MAAIKFDITGDNTGFIDSLNQIQSSVKQTSSVVQQLGEKFNMKGATEQIISLSKAISDQEALIQKARENFISLLDTADEYKQKGDVRGFEGMKAKVEQEAKNIEEYVEKLNGYKAAMNEILQSEAIDKNIEGSLTNSIQNRIKALEDVIGRITDKMDELRTRTVEVFGNSVEFKVPTFLLDDERKGYYKELTEELKQYEQELSNLQQLSKLPPPIPEEAKNNTNEQKKSLEELENELVEVQKELSNLYALEQKLKDDDSFSKKSETAQILAGAISDAKKQVEELEKEISQRKAESSGLSKLGKDSKDATDGLKELQNAFNTTKQGATDLQTVIGGASAGNASGLTGGLMRLMSLGSKAGPWGAAIAAAIAAIAAAVAGAYTVLKKLSNEAQSLKEAMLPLKAYVDDGTFEALRKGFIGAREGANLYSETLKNLTGNSAEAVSQIKLSVQSTEDMAAAAIRWVRYYDELRDKPQAILDLVNATQELATITGWTTEKTATSLTKIAGAYKMTAFEAKMAVNAIVNSKRDSVYEYEELVSALTNSAPRARAASISFNEMASALSVVSTKFPQASTAASTYAMMMTMMSTKGKKEFNPQVVGATKALQNMKKELNAGKDVLSIFHSRMRMQARDFIENADAIAEYQEKLYGATAKNKALMTQQEKAEYHAKLLENALKELSQAFNVNITPAINVCVDALALGVKMLGAFATKIGSVVNNVVPYLNKIGSFIDEHPWLSSLLSFQTGGITAVVGTQAGRSIGRGVKSWREQVKRQREYRDEFNDEVAKRLMGVTNPDRQSIVNDVKKDLIKKYRNNNGQTLAIDDSRLRDYTHFINGVATDVLNEMNASLGGTGVLPPTLPANKKDKTAEQEARRRQQLFELNMKHEQEMEEQRRALKDAQEAARIAAIKNDAEREREMMKEQARLTKQEIIQEEESMKQAIYAERQKRWELTNKNKKLVYSDTPEGNAGWQAVVLDETQQAILNAKKSKADAELERELRERRREQQQALTDYIKDYGDYYQQRLAITEEYERKIDEEIDPVKKAILAREQADKIAEVTMKELQDGLDWEYLFRDLSSMSIEGLEEIKEKLRKELSVKDITAENAQIISQKIQDIENELASRDIFTSLLPGLQRYKELMNDAAGIARDIAISEKEIADLSQKASAGLSSIQNRIYQASGGEYGGLFMDKEKIANLSTDELLKVLNLEQDSEEAKRVADEFENLKLITIDLGKAEQNRSALLKRQRNIKDSIDQFDGLGGILKAVFGTQGLGFTEIAGLVNQNVQSMSDFVDKIGLANTDFGEAVHGFADGVGGFHNAISSLVSGDVFGAVNGIIDGLIGFGNMFSSIFVGNLDNHEEMVEKQKEANMHLENIKDRVDRISDKLSESYGAKAIDTFNELKEYLLSQQEYFNKGVQAAGDDRYGGRHSEWWHRNKNGGEGEGGYVDRIKKKYGLDFQGTSWQDFFNYLSSLEEGKGAEILNNLRNDSSMIDIWEELMRTDSYDDGAIADWVSRWADSYEDIEEAKKQLAEQLTGTTEENVFEDFMNNLYNMADGAEDVFNDIAGSWQKMVNRMVINNLIGEEFKEKLKKWYGKFASAYEDKTLTEEELNALREEYNQYARDAQDKINTLRETGLIKTIDEATGGSSVSSVNKITTEQADELIGIARGGYLAIERGNGISENLLMNIVAMNELATVRNRSIDEIRALVMSSNAFLESILKNNKAILNSFSEKFDETIKYLKEM